MSIETMKLALEALEAMQMYAAAERKGLRICDEAIEALRAAIEQAEKQEPVGWVYEDDEGRMMFSQMPHPDPLWEPVYRAKPKDKTTKA